MKKRHKTLVVAVLAFATIGIAMSEIIRADSAAVRELKAWSAAEVSPQLEAFKKAHGHYPNTLLDMPGFRATRQAVKMEFAYGLWPDGHYELSFSPNTIGGFTGSRWDFHSVRGSWSLDR